MGVHRTCGEPDEIKKNTHPKNTAALFRGSRYDLINPKKLPGGKKAKKNYKNSGVLHLLSASIHVKRSLVDYLKNGLELNFSVAVDFTGSNGCASVSRSI